MLLNVTPIQDITRSVLSILYALLCLKKKIVFAHKFLIILFCDQRQNYNNTQVTAMTTTMTEEGSDIIREG